MIRKFLRERPTVRIVGLTLTGAAALVAVVAALVLSAGGVNVAASTADNALVADLLHYTFKQSVAARSASIEAPKDLETPGRIRLGAQHYAMVCSKCHGAPGLGQNPVPLSMNPRPQYLPAVLEQFDDPELFWIVQHGVAYSAMPAWVTQDRGDEVWSMVAFLRTMGDMSASDYLALASVPRQQIGDPLPYGAPSETVPSTIGSMSAPLDEFSYRAPAIEFSEFAAAGDPLATCARCHGPDGSGSPTSGEAPNLTLQNADYLKAALAAYASGKRHSGFMQPIAAQLSRSQIDAIAEHYAGLPPVAASAANGADGAADPKLLARGADIAANGLPDDAIPGCSTCHNSRTADGAIAIPRIAGQSEVFLRRQLTVFRAGGRGSTGIYNPMAGEAHRLTDGDIAALAAYYASLPTETTAPAAALSSAAGDTRAKALIGRLCVTCHQGDMRGLASGVFPNLTLQTPEYIAQALREYREGRRDNAQMNLIGRDLKDEDIKALSDYVGRLPATSGPAEARSIPDPDAVARGAAIAEGGIAGRDIPACLACHGDRATAELPLIAHIQGQNAHYLSGRLEAFASPAAVAPPDLNPMPAIARRLTAQERNDVAAWFAARPPLAKTAARR